jgi:hypothetical protein
MVWRRVPAKMASRTKIVLLGLALALLGSVALRDETRVIQELENGAHAPVFGIASLILHSTQKGSRRRRYLLARNGAVVLGAALEGLQAVTGQGGEWISPPLTGSGCSS